MAKSGSTPSIPVKANFGTAPVFLTAISTILGAMMFLRFGYAVGNVGFLGTLGIVVIGHIVTIATAMSIAEIATNQKVEGGGEYYIISRSFGLNIGSAIGIALFLSQAVSVAFYIIAFGEAFDPLLDFIYQKTGCTITSKKAITLPAMLILTVLMLTKGADLGVKALYIVVAILSISMIFFFLGSTGYTSSIDEFHLSKTVENPDGFFKVFAIIFPAFTGMTAGVGLSGDLKDPSKSIPLGTLAATIFGAVIYVFIAFKLSWSASPEDLSNDQLVMGKIALWGPIIPIGLAAATFSSALGSIMVAPRTLQAIAGDRIFPGSFLNRILSKGTKKKNEPFNASVLVCVIAIVFIAIGDVNFVAEIISMFFMVTYGAICLISFLEHFAADPAYRPAFKSKWYISAVGAVMCVWLMFKMNSGYAFLSLGVMALIYVGVSSYRKDSKGLASIFKGVVYQLSRQLQLFVQKRQSEDEKWRPSVVCISADSFQNYDAFEMLKWISKKYGFGTYIHHIEGYVSKTTNEKAREAVRTLVDLAATVKSNVFVDCLISPSYTTAIAQVLQLPGISGKDNNMILFNYSSENDENLEKIITNYALVKSLNFDVAILRSTHKKFGYMREIHIWVKPADIEIANLMILMAYIVLGHRDWKDGVIKIFAAFPENELVQAREKFNSLVTSGRLPISLNNINVLPKSEDQSFKDFVNEKSYSADLSLIGFRSETIKHSGAEVFKGYDSVGNILFVNTTEAKIIE